MFLYLWSIVSVCPIHGTKESIIMTSGIDSAGVLRQAQQVHKQAETTHKKGVQTEANDMKKANSIFTEAEKIINAEADKAIKTGDSAEQDINKLKQDAEKIGNSEINPVKTLMDEYKKTLEDALKKKEELESKLNGDEQNEAKELSVSKNVQKQIKTTSKSGTKTNSTEENNESSTEGITVSTESVDADDKSALMQEYRDTLAQIDALSSLSASLGGKLETSSSKLSNIINKIENQKNSANEKLNSIESSISSKSAQKTSELNPLIQSQTNDGQIHSQMSTSASQASDTASLAASQLKETDPNKMALESVSKELAADSQNLSELSTQKNSPNANTNIPKISTDIQQMLNNVVQGDFGKINEIINMAYSDAIGTIQSYDSEIEVSESDTKTKDAEVSSEGTKDNSKTNNDAMIQSVLSSISGGSSIEGIVENIASQALDQIMPGLGSIASGVFNTLKGIFS